MSTTGRKKLTLKSVTVSLGCGSCRRSKLAGIFFNPTPNKPSSHLHQHRRSSSSQEKSPALYDSAASPFVAVEKNSDNPYLDFRQSMLQMVLENELYSKDDLRELLNCFLQLNSPHHHGIIVRAFTEIWNGAFSASLRHGGVGYSKPLSFGCRSRNFYGV